MKNEFKVIADLIEKDKKVLDVGCADGILMKFLKDNKNANIAAAPIPGPARGNSTFQKACNLVHPSVLATSDISLGICLKKPSVNQMVKGTFIAT